LRSLQIISSKTQTTDPNSIIHGDLFVGEGVSAKLYQKLEQMKKTGTSKAILFHSLDFIIGAILL